MKKRILCVLLSCAMLLGFASMASAAAVPVLAPAALANLDGKLLIADLYNRAIWLRSADGSLEKLAGRAGVPDLHGDPLGGYADGPANEAAFQSPSALAPYLGGWAIADAENNVVRYWEAETVSTLAGSGKIGTADGVGLAASFDGPMGLAAGADGALYVSDTGNNSIRMIDKTGKVSTVLEKSAGLVEPTALCYADGVLYIADAGNHRICKLENGQLSTLAGSATEDGGGYRDGAAEQALFVSPQGLAYRDDALYIADTGNGVVRVLQNGTVSTLVKSGEGTAARYPVSPVGLAFVGDSLFVGDTFSRVLFSVEVKKQNANFKDVPASAWFAAAVQRVQEAGLMTGLEEGIFAPESPMSRAMCVTILSRLAKAEGKGDASTNAFLDVPPDAYYAKSVAWAVSQKLLEGEDGKFLPDRSLSRAELIEFLSRLAKTAPSEGATLETFVDANTVPAWAESALRWGVESGILIGHPNQILAANSTITRAEAATMLTRYLDWSEKQ